ncbi:MAG: Smr/MutS family protein [Sandarakinorhabdus sp.]|nr:Smr/MutS family protein [Sandarakinorhabdus sp.]
MARRLSAHEIALWSRVAATVRPIGGKAPSAAPAPPPPPVAAPRQPAASPAAIPPRPLHTPAKPKASVAATTLDGSWDRRLRQGDISPDRVIDLHGHTLAAAHHRLAEALDNACAQGERIILIITGKGRDSRPGRIKAELNHWLDSGNHRSRIAALRPAHARHGGSGAFYLILRRR